MDIDATEWLDGFKATTQSTAEPLTVEMLNAAIARLRVFPKEELYFQHLRLSTLLPDNALKNTV